MYMHRTTILLPDKLRREAEAEASRRGISLSQLIRDQLEKLTRARRGGPTRRRDPLFANASPVDAGEPDLAARHDDYLYGER